MSGDSQNGERTSDAMLTFTESVNRRRIVGWKKSKIFSAISLGMMVLVILGVGGGTVSNGLMSERSKSLIHKSVTGCNKDIHTSNITEHTMDGIEMDARLKSPFTAMLAGPTGSGKTHLIMNLIEQSQTVSFPPPVEIVYCYEAWQKVFEPYQDRVRFVEGLIDVKTDMVNDGRNRWLIIDDLMEEGRGKENTNALYTKYSHHMNISVFFIVQNLFPKGNRTVSINTQYFFLFKNPRDATSVGHLGRQVYPGKKKFISETFEEATKLPYSYLFMDLKQETDDRLRLIGNFASQNKSMVVYTPSSL